MRDIKRFAKSTSEKSIKLLILVLIMAFITMFVAGCQNPEAEQKGVDDIAVVWSALSTEKYMLDYQNENYTEAKLDFVGIKNEVQSAQLMLTAKQKINSFDLKADNLHSISGDEVISKEKVSIYAERYVETYNPFITNANLYLPLIGYYPDALVPIDRYIARRENSVEKQNNQGIWIDIKIDKDVTAGTYNGVFKLIINDLEKDIPVSLKVYNITMPDEVHNPTMIDIWYSTIGAGEGDNVDSNTFDVYYEYLLTKRLTCENLPPQYAGSIQAFVDRIVTAALDQRVTTYRIPNPSIDKPLLYSEGVYTQNEMVQYRENVKNNLKGQLKAILDKNIEVRQKPDATESEQNIDLFKKAVYYFEDEPYGVRIQQLKVFCMLLKQAKDEIKIENADIFEQHADLEESLSKVDEICPTDYIDECSVTDYDISDGLTLWCPSMFKWDSAIYREKMLAKQANGERVWWYTCVHNSPYPSYLVDSIPMNIRLQAWMQYDYSIEGILYWQTCAWNYTEDVYEDIQVSRLGAGEGILMYPGAKYGMKVPVSSIRLEQLRLGQQDYEYFWMLDQELKAIESTVTAQELISKLGESLYDGTTIKSGVTERDFENCRIRLLNILEMFVNNNATGAINLINDIMS